MFAVVDIAGQQFKVVENEMYYVPKLDADLNSEVTFDKVFLHSKDDKLAVGTPTVNGMKVRVKVLEHLQDGKVIVFKKKRRKSYRVKNGHRQQLTKIEVTKIGRLKKVD